MPLALATPLLVPFAEAAGITIAAVATAAGATILQDKIQDYMQENPEKSKRILDVIMATMPGGLGDIFLKEEITTNDGEEMTEEESVDDRSTKEIVLDALGKKKGNYSSPDAEGNYSSKRGRIIKELEKSGTVETGPNKDYDSSKKYKGYKKFFNEGGLAGTKTYHQVRDLTVPQDLEGIMNYKTGGRVNLSIGGNPEDQYGLQYDDQEVGIINTDNQMAFRPNSMKDKGLRQLDVMPDMNQKRYDNLRKEDVEQFNEKGIPLSLPKDRYKGIEGYTAMAIDPNRMTDAYSGFRNNTTSPVPEDIDMQYTVGNEFNVTPQQTISQRFGNNVKSGLGSIKDFGGAILGKAAGIPGVSFAMNALGKMDQFDTLNDLDKNFILDQAGGNRPSKDPFGINRRSAFGNYGAYVDKLYEKDKDKVYDPITQKFLYDRKVYNDKLATKRAADLFIAQQEETAAKERAANIEFQRLAAANRARDESSGSGGPGETTSGTFGSSVNNSSTFSDYS